MISGPFFQFGGTVPLDYTDNSPSVGNFTACTFTPSSPPPFPLCFFSSFSSLFLLYIDSSPPPSLSSPACHQYFSLSSLSPPPFFFSLTVTSFSSFPYSFFHACTFYLAVSFSLPLFTFQPITLTLSLFNPPRLGLCVSSLSTPGGDWDALSSERARPPLSLAVCVMGSHDNGHASSALRDS